MKDISFSVATYAQDGNILYFSSQDNTGLYILNMDTLKIQYKNYFPFRNFNGRFLWGKALKVEGGIWFSPFFYTLSSLFYDIEKNSFSPIEHSVVEKLQVGHPYCYMASYKGMIYVFPIMEKQVLIYDQSREFLKSVVVDINEDVFTMYAAVDKNKIYLPISNSNRIIEFDMETLAYSQIVIGTEEVKILDIKFIQDSLYFSVMQRAELYCYNLENGALKSISISDVEAQIDSIGYDGHNIWGTILHEDKIFKTDLSLSQLESWDIPVQKNPLPDNCLWRKEAPLNYRYMIDYENKWYITSDYENAIYVFDRITNNFTDRISICVSQKIEEVVLFDLQMQRLGIIIENKDRDLKYYLRMIER